MRALAFQRAGRPATRVLQGPVRKAKQALSLPAAVTNPALSEEAQDQAFQQWILGLASDGFELAAKLPDIRAAMDIAPQGALTDAKADPRWSAANKWVRLSEIGANNLSNFSLIGGQIQCNSTNPGSITITNGEIEADPAQFFAYAHGAGGPGAGVPEIIDRVKLTGGRSAAMDGYGAKAVSRFHIAATGGDGISIGESLGPQTYTLGYIENGGQAAFGANNSSHADGIQALSGDDLSFRLSVLHAVGTTDPSSTYQPVNPTLSTGTFGVNSAIIASPNTGNRRIERLTIGGVLMAWGGPKRINLSADSAGEVMRNVTIRFCIDCPDEMLLAVGGQQAFYDNSLDEGVLLKQGGGYQQGNFENILSHEFRKITGAMVQYNGADSDGIYRWNPYTIDAPTTLRWQNLGYLDGSGNPLPGKKKWDAPMVWIDSATVSATEGNALQITFRRNWAGAATSIPYSIVLGTLTASDFPGGVIPPDGSIPMPVGVDTAVLSIATNDDTNLEGDETLIVNCGIPQGYGRGPTMSCTGTVLNNDAGVTPYTMLHDFESGSPSSTTVTVSFDTSSRKLQGAQGLKLVAIGNTAGNFSSQSVTALKTGIATDFAPFERLALCVDFGETGYQPMKSMRLSFFSGGLTYGVPGTAADEFSPGLPFLRGKHWITFGLDQLFSGSTAGNPTIRSVGTASKELRATFVDPTFYAGAVDAVIDGAVLMPPSAFKPSIGFSLDDMSDEQYFNFKALLDSFGIGMKATVNEASGFIGNAGKWTQAQLNEVVANGWAICSDSGPNDEPLPSLGVDGTVAGALDVLWPYAQSIGAKYGDTEHYKHMVFSFGGIGYKTSGPTNANNTITASCAGNVLTATGASVPRINGFCARGVRIFTPAGVLAGIVNRFDFSGSESKVYLDRSPGDFAATTLYMSCYIPRIAVVANGTNVITVNGADAPFIFPGMHFRGYTGNSNQVRVTNVVIVNSTQSTVTLDGNVPASCVVADFPYIDGEWYPTKVADAMLAKGFLSGRAGANGSGFSAPFGMDPRSLMLLPALSLAGTNLSTHQAWITFNALAGRNQLLYVHGCSAAACAPGGYYHGIVSTVAGLYNDGTIDGNWTQPAIYNKIMARGAFA